MSAKCYHLVGFVKSKFPLTSSSSFGVFPATTSNVLVTSTAIPTTTHSASSTQAVFARTTKGISENFKDLLTEDMFF